MKTKQEIVENWLPRYTKRRLEEFDEYIFEDGNDFMINIKFKDGSTYTFYDEIAYDTYHKIEHVREFYPDGRVYIQLVPYFKDGELVNCSFWFECIA